MQHMSLIQSIWTVIVFVIFIGIVLWSWSGKNKADFEKAARIPLDDQPDDKNHSEEGLMRQEPETLEKNNG